ncbi:MAG: DNA primase [Sphingomonadales bacterium 32-68-7]|nr:MAG: DNA primase [Sphingomonadales bacterium 12-68-11]OYX10112.1 MAG: DNA primase [Sphingomonadales bacterium 32-68-7]
MALSPQWLDELRARITLSGVIMATVKLQRAGREWKACCPFHNENTPSFYVNDEKHFYHCFGCGAHGDAIRWMTDQRGLAFMDAVKELAAQAGMDVPAPDPRAARAAEQRATLHDVTGAAQAWFEANLASDEAGHARAYLKTRGFDARTVARFGFGYAPNRRDGIKKALPQFDEALLGEAGMLIAAEDKAPYDRFRDRLTIPIHDARGRVIGFAARILDAAKKDAPKYLNSPDTPLFDKGRTLFNLHHAAPAARKVGRIVVVEGQMDVVALAAAGIDEVVAPMGTALTETQLELLWRQAEKPVLCFDGDAAGQKAALRAVGRALPMLKPGYSLEFVTLPKGLDPDDVVRRDGRAGLERLLASPQGLLDLVWEREQAAGPLASPEDKAGLKARLIEHAEAIQHPDIRALYRREWLDRFSAFAFPPRPPRPAREQRAAPGKRWGQLTIGPLAPGTADRLRRATTGGGARDGLAQAVLAGLARHPGEIARHSEGLLELAAAEPALAAAIDALLDHRPGVEGSAMHPISRPGISSPPPDQAHYSFLMEGADPTMAREDLAEAMALLVEWPAVDSAIDAATARWDTDPDGTVAELGRLTKRKLELRARLGQMARKRAASAALQDERSEAGVAPDDRQETG